MLEKQSQKNRSLSQDVKRKVVGWIPERAVHFSRLQSRDDDCNYYVPILCWLCFLIIVNWQLYLMVSVEFSQGGQYLQNNSCKTKLNVFQLPENGDLGKIWTWDCWVRSANSTSVLYTSSIFCCHLATPCSPNLSQSLMHWASDNKIKLELSIVILCWCSRQHVLSWHFKA